MIKRFSITRFSITRFSWTVAAAAALLLAPAGAAWAEISVSKPWARATTSAAKVSAGYAVIENAAAEPDRLIGARADFAERVEIHEMSVDAASGRMRMRPVAGGLEAPAGGMVELKPGGLHLMFMGLREPLTAGERRAGVLVFEKAGEVAVEFAVQPLAATGAPEE